MPVEASLIANCRLCDSFFVLIAKTFELKSYKGKKGTQQLETEIEELQATLSPCHSCSG